MKINVELGEVQKTLLMPLWGRAREYESKNPIVRDKYALEIINKLDYDFEKMSRSFEEYFQKYWATRALNIDRAILKLTDKFPDATIVNLGAGLDTTFQRVDNGRILCYDIDLPDTIKLRKELIQEAERNLFITKSLLDKSWFEEIKSDPSKILFVASGVFCYFDKNTINNLFLDLINKFPGSEIIFDLMSPLIIWLSNREAAHNKEKKELSPMIWGARSSKSIRKWSNKIQVIEEYPIFSRISIDKSWNKHTISQIKQMNFFRWVNMVHLKFN